MRALEFTTGHVIHNPAYTYKFQLKTNLKLQINLVMLLDLCGILRKPKLYT